MSTTIRWAPAFLASFLILFGGLGFEGFIDHDRLAEGLSGLGVLGSVLGWFLNRNRNA